MTSSVIVGGARTPVGRLLGSLKSFSGADLGGFAIKAALEKTRVNPAEIQYVIMGQVLTAGGGPDTGPAGSRQGRRADDRSGGDRQQGLPFRDQRDRPGRPADPSR
jgi:acetyl-CoA acetyltransferase